MADMWIRPSKNSALWMPLLNRSMHVTFAENGQAGVNAAESLRPDLVLLDVSMPLMGGFPAARLLNVSMPDVPIIFVTQHTDRFYVEEAFQCGAKGYVIKRAAVTELPSAINTVMKGQVFCSPLITS